MILRVTFFDDAFARTKRDEACTLEALAEKIRRASAPEKSKLPWLKLAAFGDKRTEKKSLRHDDNVRAISGVETDYDGKLVGGDVIRFEQAVAIIEKAGLRALLYTSPSHSESRPRWRVLCPTSRELPPGRRADLLGKLNHLFGGALSDESWTLSQSYYYGAVHGNKAHRVEIVEGDFIDKRSDIEWRGRRPNGKANGADGGERVDRAAELDRIMSGDQQHKPLLALIGSWARAGMASTEAREMLLGAFQRVPEERRDKRWREHEKEIDEIIAHVYKKETNKRAAEYADAEGLSADDLARVAELALLGTIAYGQARKDAAKRLKIGVATLDKLVKGYRMLWPSPTRAKRPRRTCYSGSPSGRGSSTTPRAWHMRTSP